MLGVTWCDRSISRSWVWIARGCIPYRCWLCSLNIVLGSESQAKVIHRLEARRAYLKLSSWIWISKQWYQDTISRSTITHLGKVGVKPNWMTLDTYVLGSGCIKPSRSHGILLARLVIVGTDYRDGEATSGWIIYYSSHHNSPGYRIVPCSSIILLFYYSTLFCFSLLN